MYAHVPALGSRPASASSTVFPDPPYPYSSQGGSGFIYDISSGYPPLPTPRSSSSSLAAALDPTPELDHNAPSASPSQLAGRPDEQSNGRAFVNQNLVSGNVTAQMDTPHRFAKSYERHFVDDAGSFRSQHQTYQVPEVLRHALNQPECSSSFLYPPPSSSYTHSQQPSIHAQTNEPGWPTGVALPSYSDNVSLPSVTRGIAESSHFPSFADGYSFNSAGVSNGGFEVYSNGSAATSWPYAQMNSSFQTSEGLYLDFTGPSASSLAGASTWSGPSFDSQSHFQTEPSGTYVSSSALSYVTSEAGTNSGQSNAGLSAEAVNDGYFDRRQHVQQLCEPQEEASLSAIQNQYQSATQISDERMRDSIAHSKSNRPASSIPSTPDSVQSVRSVMQHKDDDRCGETQQHRGHNTLMPPPPLPVRAHTLATEPPQSESRPSQSPTSRRHTVTVLPLRNDSIRAEGVSPTSSVTATAARPSSAAPESTSSSCLHDDVASEGPATPRLATMSLNDSMWAQAQERNRCALTESFRLLHGVDPPTDMSIRETSAIERSRRNELTLSKFDEEKIGQLEYDRNSGKASARPLSRESQEMEGAIQSVARIAPEDIRDEDFFNRPPSADWVPALSGYGIEQEAATLETHSNSTSLVSPISPATTDELVTPGDESSLTTARKAQLPYAYASPANPDTLAARPQVAFMRNVLSVIRHDGHLPQHVSGLGGSFQNAYDGRSYLTDDSEQDPDHVPPAPPGARSGDHPVVASFLPHPLAKRGQVWHDLIDPILTSRLSNDRQKRNETGAASECDESDLMEVENEEASLKKLENEGIKKEERGEGWGFVEAGSHGPQFALPNIGKAGSSNRHAQRLKLSTEKKTPPKMACHFCRNRKIACGASKSGDPTICNQCERRNIRCTFPTMSRRGMRSRNQRSAHTVDGTDEADKDSLECEESSGNMEILAFPPDRPGRLPGTITSKRIGKTRKQSEKNTKGKDGTKGSNKGRGKRNADLSEERLDGSKEMNDEDTEMDSNAQLDASRMQIDRMAGYADDPLASLAAEMHWSAREDQPEVPSSMQFRTSSSAAFSASPSLSSLSTALHFTSNSFEDSFPVTTSNETYTSQIGPSPGPFTTNPLQRRNQHGNAGSDE